MRYERIQVKCSSGYPKNDRPVSFLYRDREYPVSGIIDRWHEGGHRPGRPTMNYLKVRTAHGDEFILRYNTLFDAWALLIKERG